MRILAASLLALASLIAGCGGGGGGDDDDGADAAIPPEPEDVCPTPVEPVDTTTATVIGDGTPASCTEDALDAALATGGNIRFACGPAFTLTVTREHAIDKDVVLDGGGEVTLSGGGTTRILAMRSSFERDTPHLVVQNLTFADGSSVDAPGSLVEKFGGAIYRIGGRLTVIDSLFVGNRCPEIGGDVAGGAIGSVGGGETVIVGSRFTNNQCASGGALGNLGNSLSVSNTVITGNTASGIAGAEGGNGGGISMDGENTALTLCGVELTGNTAHAFGGALFRFAYHQEPVTIAHSVLDGNVIESGDRVGMGGALYLQNVTATITSSSITRNQCTQAGAIFFGPSAVANLLNVTIADNVATSGLGGGIAADASATGILRHVTLAGNRAPGEGAFAGAIAGGEGLTLQSSIITDSFAGNGYNPISCTRRLTAAGTSFQWPVIRSAGGSDDPDALCAAGITLVDPMLAPLADAGGPGDVRRPLPGSPVIAVASDCPETDQLGKARTEPCAAGAVEPE